MNVSLTPILEELVDERVRGGHYQSASEVIREALRRLFGEDNFRETRAEEVRRQIQIGIDEIRRGEGIPFEEAIEKLEKKHNEIAARKGK